MGTETNNFKTDSRPIHNFCKLVFYREVGLQYNSGLVSPQTYTRVSKSQKAQPLILQRHALPSTAFNKRQKKLLKEIIGLYPVLQRSAAHTITTCQAAFNESRWNCSSLNHLPDLSPELDSGRLHCHIGSDVLV